ncbi:MAG: hypothetical protein JO041_12445, partial [Acidobacteria bacterium]|nr:hypothetical protein [Acidobacteriota bacterium]
PPPPPPATEPATTENTTAAPTPGGTAATAPTPTPPKPRPRRPAVTHKPASASQPKAAQQAPAAQPPQPAAQQASNHTDPTAAAAPASGLSPGMPTDQAQHTRDMTDQLLKDTEANLSRLKDRQLTDAQNKMVDEIKNYMQRARSAQTDGDLNLARNFAVKAHQLSDVLVGQ